MSEFSCPVVQIGKITKHPGADSLSLVEVEGNPVVIRTGDFQEGDPAIYIPVEAVVPFGLPAFEFLRDPNHPERENARVKAKRLRGVFSMGLLIKPFTPGSIGKDMAPSLGIVKYQEPDDIAPTAPRAPKSWWKVLIAWIKHPVIMTQMFIQNNRMRKVRSQNFLPIYDMESFRKYRNVIYPGEPVYLSEKLHGTNFRCGYHKGKFFVGSHKTFKGENTTDLYWKTAIAYDLKKKLKAYPDLAIYGEIYGSKVQDLTYGAKQGETRLAVFDLYDTNRKRFLDYTDFVHMCDTELELSRVPELYVGPYTPELDALASGKTTVRGANNIREGFVIKPLLERRAHVGRVIFKLIGEEYLLRRGGTEKH